MARATKSKADSLLIELRTEELPPKSLRRLSEVFAEGVEKALRDAHLLTDGSTTTPFATPRRLAVRVSGVLAQQTDREQNRQGPKEGAPAQAVEGFARGLGVSVDKLSVQDGRYAYAVKIKGEPLAKLVPEFVAQALKALPIPKVMRWGDGEAQFVRPVHGLILLHGSKLIPGTVLGIKSGNKTLGHRFLSKGQLVISHADRYESILKGQGKVIAGFDERRDEIVRRLKAEAGDARWLLGAYRGRDGKFIVEPTAVEVARNITDEARAAATWILGRNQDLLDEVTALVEWPAVYAGEFEREYLAVPAQCISLTMQKNQKYFALMSQRAELLPKYLLVSNLETGSPNNIVHGNARVLRARLSDAKFFYEQDRKARLDSRVPRLANVVYHNKLGSQLERVQRLEKLAVAIAEQIGSDVRLAERAARLCKADLLTEMVGEFPELQGFMGYYYALHDGEDPAVAGASIAHYQPRFAGDGLPRSTTGICVALADKLDTLVGIYGIGLVPTGDKDPFGLRRQALGVVRILVEKSLSLDLGDLLQLARSQFPAGIVAESVAQDLMVFIADRLRPWLREQDFEADEIEAVLALGVTRLDQLLPRLKALKAFRRLPEAEALAAANKRIRNILKQAGGKPRDQVDASLLREDAERVLAEQVNARRAEVEPLFVKGDFEAALRSLASLRGPVDTFFDKVMVMVEDESLKQNRLALLNSLSNLFLGAADISRLQGRQP
ncbi:MAG: glycine--tRNA ligase subunit beta [Pseudomonadota bacterium]